MKSALLSQIRDSHPDYPAPHSHRQKGLAYVALTHLGDAFGKVSPSVLSADIAPTKWGSGYHDRGLSFQRETAGPLGSQVAKGCHIWWRQPGDHSRHRGPNGHRWLYASSGEWAQSAPARSEPKRSSVGHSQARKAVGPLCDNVTNLTKQRRFHMTNSY